MEQLSPKKNAFVLTSTDIGSLLVNRFDSNTENNGFLGVGGQLLENSIFDFINTNLAHNFLISN